VNNKLIWIKQVILAAILIALPGWATAEITVEGAWVRMPPPVADTAAAYLVLNNSGETDVNITSVESAAAGKPEFHSMDMNDGMMHMQKMEKVVVPAHGKIEFAPGADHLMLKDLKKKLNAGDHVVLKLNTSDGQTVEVHAEVRDMRKIQDSHGAVHGDGHGAVHDAGHAKCCAGGEKACAKGEMACSHKGHAKGCAAGEKACAMGKMGNVKEGQGPVSGKMLH
jgi:copper(I)-binding protein